MRFSPGRLLKQSRLPNRADREEGPPYANLYRILTPLPVCVFLAFALVLSALAADRTFTPYADAKPVLDAQRGHLPDGLKNPNQAEWSAWSRQEDKAIRARLLQGDLDSMVNLLLYGISFTKQPRIAMENITAASKAGVLRARVDDLVAGLRKPGDNERLIFVRGLVRREGIDPADGSPKAGVFIYNQLLRVLKERMALAKRDAAANGPAGPDADRDPAAVLDTRASLFRDRGISLDTRILPSFSIDRTLSDLKRRGVLREGQVARVAVIGPGLDVINKDDESAYDYYPQQTLQPFALYDSLLRLGLAKAGALSMSIFDISSQVTSHIQRAREHAKKNMGYVIQLPHDAGRPWPPELVAYWRSLGGQVGTEVKPIQPPEVFRGLETRAIRVRPDVVLSCEPADLNIVLERLNLPAADRFDLMVATNIFIYYDAFEQMLALENAGAMLKPGGLLLSNDRLPEVPGGSMRQAGLTSVQYDYAGVHTRDAVVWYQKR
jgi:hypothetical protein